MSKKELKKQYPLRFNDFKLWKKLENESKKQDRSINSMIITIIKEYFKNK